jgi:hypothetical protein
MGLVVPAFLAVPVAQQQFQTRVDVVRLDVSVTNDQGYVPGLVVDDFIVEDQGSQQTFTVEEFVDTPLDLVLVAPPLSAVNYIAADQVNRTAAGIAGFLEQIEGRDRAAVIVASPPPRRVRALEPGRPPFVLEPFQVGSQYYSASFDAIALGLRAFTPSERRQALVAFTNAADFRSVLRADTAAQLAGRLGPAFIVVGTPVSIQMQVRSSAELRDGRPLGDPVEGNISGRVLSYAVMDFAKDSGGLLVNLADGDPRELMAELVTSLRTRYVLTYELPKGEGWHEVKVRVNRGGVKVMTRNGYYVN